MKRLITTSFIFIFLCNFSFAQVAINADGSPPHSSAGLEINFPNKGFLLPRLTYEQRNDIPSPAEGLIIYCTNCNADGSGALSIYQGNSWRLFNLNCAYPNTPTSGVRVPYATEITWKWNPVPIAQGYRWNTINDYNSSLDLGDTTSYTESGLVCWTNYERWVWAYNECGASLPLKLTGSTIEIPFAPSPTAGFTATTSSTILWTWGAVPDAIGYRFGDTNDFYSADTIGVITYQIDTGLTCLTEYTRYVWAYSDCGFSQPLEMSASTSSAPPSAPVAANHVATPTQIVWNWNAVSGADGYLWNTINDTTGAVNTGTSTTFSENNLTCLSAYTRYIWAYNECGVSATTTLTKSTLSNPPAPPSPATHVPSEHQVIWNWNPVEGAEGYKWNTVNDYNSAQSTGTLTTKTETGLNCNTNYSRYVWAFSSCGVSTVTTLTQKTLLDPPAAPTAAAPTPSATQMVWNWNVVSGATGYKWGVTNDTATAINVGNTTSHTETGLTCNTGYTRYVWAYSSCGVSTACTLTGTTSLNPPAAPTAGTHTPSPTQVVWRWNTVSGATGYKWSPTNDYGSASDLGNVTSHTETGLTCNTSYTRFVWAYSNCGVSAVTSLTQTTSLDPPAAPVAATHVPSPTQVVWNWNASSGATSYLWNTTNNLGTATNLGNVTTYTETGLSCNTGYTRYIWAASNCGTSSYTTLSQTTSMSPPASPTTSTHVPSATQIVWNWNTVTGATGYKWNTTNNYGSAIDMGSATSRTETGLTCNTAYNRYVWAYSNCGVSPVTTLSQLTSMSPPASPSAGTHVPSATQIVWNWNTVAGATGYKWSTSNDFNGATEMGTLTTKTETGLTCNTGYTRYVWAYSNCGVSNVTTLTQTTSLDPPASPTAGTHVAELYQITWNWGTVGNATGYKWSSANDFSTAVDVGNTTSHVETGLACNAPYIRFVWAYSTCGNSASTTLNASTLTSAPALPVAATNVAGPTQITWKWHPVANATGYKWYTEKTFTSAIDLGTDTSRVETGLVCQTGYTRYIWAYGECGHSLSTTIVQSTTDDPPAVPIAATHIATASQIEWHFNTVPNANGYKWSASNNYANATDLGTNTTWTESGLACNMPYTRYVWAYGSCGVSAAATFTKTTLNTPPASPVAGTHTPSADQIVWNWNAAPDATGYLWNSVNDTLTALNVGSSTSHTQTGLNCNTLYNSYVWAYNTCSKSASTMLTQVTSLNPPAAPAEGTHIAQITAIEWHWNAVDGATGYMWNTVNDTSTATHLGNVLTTTQSGLVCNSAYTTYVWSYSNCGVSTATSLTKSTLQDPPPAAVEGTHTATGSQIVWNWTASQGATGYKWNTTTNYTTASDIGNVTTKTETGLACNTLFNRYLWAYNSCGVSTMLTLSKSTTNESPDAPVAGTHTPSSTQIIWNWNAVPGASGYKWSTTNDYANAIDNGNSTTRTETGLSCNVQYTRYIWAYNSCGGSASTPISETTVSNPLAAPTAGTHVPNYTEITWNWNTVSGATGYKWSTTNDFNGATNMGTATTKTETGLTCGSNYTRYAWAYDGCGNSTALTMTASTLACWTCTNPLTIYHVADTVAPVTKTVTYGTVNNVPGETSKCWITSNLGADQQATNYNDNTEASAGWYWQFDRARGFKHDGTTRTPNTTWITSVYEYSTWITNNDPCYLELGTGWRVPTVTEWSNVDASGGWVNWTGPWNSLLKMHAAGRLDYYYGTLSDRGSKGLYWSSSQTGTLDVAQCLYFFAGNSSTSSYQKSYGHTIRCIHN